MKFFKYIIILILSFVFISCANIGKSPAKKEDLVGKNFSLISPVKNERITLSFDENRIFGSGGVNRFFGIYKFENNSFSFGPLATTMMAGPQEDMDREYEILKILESNKTVYLSKGVLTITSKNGKVLKYIETPNKPEKK